MCFRDEPNSCHIGSACCCVAMLLSPLPHPSSHFLAPQWHTAGAQPLTLKWGDYVGLILKNPKDDAKRVSELGFLG